MAVTGASGYVGGLICRAFVEKEWRVLGLGRHDPHILRVEWMPWSLQQATLPPQAKDVNCLVHAAYDFRSRQASASWATNVDGSRVLLASLPAGCAAIFVSSIAATPTSRQTYAVNKLAIETSVIARGGVVIRPGLVRGEPQGGMLGKLAALAGLPVLPVPAARAPQYTTSARSLQDTVVARASEVPWRSELVTVVDGRPIKFIDLLRELAGPRRLMFPVPWRPLWLCLRLAEVVGLALPISADSLYGLATSGTLTQHGVHGGGGPE